MDHVGNPRPVDALLRRPVDPIQDLIKHIQKQEMGTARHTKYTSTERAFSRCVLRMSSCAHLLFLYVLDQVLDGVDRPTEKCVNGPRVTNMIHRLVRETCY